MPVDPTKAKRILIVHGVQTGEDKDQNQDQDIKKLIETRLNGAPLEFKTEMYRYENINDEAQALFKKVVKLLLNALDPNPIARIAIDKATENAIDLIGDVVIALHDGSTAYKIRQGLVDRIKEIHEQGSPLYLVAHSLGTIYAFDAVNQLIGTDGYFDRDNRKTWPILGLVTLGSPLGLSMFSRNHVKPMGKLAEGASRKFLKWFNYWDRTDPVVSLSFYGKPQEGYDIVERFSTKDDACGWYIQDRPIDTGKAWLMAHVGYWSHPPVGDDLVSLLI